jgi:hypothetical protein
MFSNSEQGVMRLNISVLKIEHRNKFFKLKSSLFASSFLSEVALFNAKIHFLKVITPAKFESTPIAIASMNKFAAQSNLKNYTANLCVANSVEGGIVNFSNEIEADMNAIAPPWKTTINLFNVSQSHN